jgi:hypothetical protein
LKATYKFSEIAGNDIILAPSTRVLYRGHPVLDVKNTPINQVTNVGSLLTATIGEHTFAVGDWFEVDYVLGNTFSYRVQDTDLSNPVYHPAEIQTLPPNSFSRGGVISAVTSTTISWTDSSFVPLYTNGYRTGQTPTPVPVVAAIGNTIPTIDIVTVTFGVNIANTSIPGGAWNVKIGDHIRVNLVGTGATPPTLNNASYVAAIVLTNNSIQLGFDATFDGNTNFVGTCNLAPLSNLLTGNPQLLEDGPSLTPINIAVMYANTPYAMLQRPSNPSDPDAYDSANNIALDDIVTIGITTGCSILSEAFSEFLWQRSTLAIRGSLNENDPEINKQIKDLELAITGDTAGRVLGRKVERTFSLFNNYRRPTRG